MERLYIVVRNDIPPGLQIAQSCHALRAFAAEHPELDAAWHAGADNLVVLQVPGERELLLLRGDLERAGVPAATFREPDLGGEVTALAAAGQAKRMLRALPLALGA